MLDIIDSKFAFLFLTVPSIYFDCRLSFGRAPNPNNAVGIGVGLSALHGSLLQSLTQKKLQGSITGL